VPYCQKYTYTDCFFGNFAHYNMRNYNITACRIDYHYHLAK